MSTRLPIPSIVVGYRHRKNCGDIDALAASIKDVGLLHPVVVTEDHRLIAGQRRLEACKLLGWPDVPVHFVTLNEVIRGEYAENAVRVDFLPSEIDAIRRDLLPLEEKAATDRRIANLKQNEPNGKLSRSAEGRARDKVGAFAGVSGRTVEKIAKVIQAAESQPEKFGHLAELMDKTGKIDGAYRELVITQKREAYQYQAEAGCTVDDLGALAASGKRYSVIYGDPPWEFKVYSGKGKQRSAERHYDTSGLDAIMALPVEQLAAENSALLLWCVMPELPGALEVIKAWGFTYKTVGFTWVKQNRGGEGLFTGMGYWTRANAELCLLATRGSPQRLAMDVPQVLLSPVGEHSQKPEEARRRIQRLLAGPYLELYGRKPVEGWTVWGNQIERAEFNEMAEVA